MRVVYLFGMVPLNILWFIFSTVVIWQATTVVVKGMEQFSKNLRISSFAASFLLLGILTSITEISVGLNSVLEKTPEIFVGNLIGGSFVILVLIIPLLAIFNKGVVFQNHLDHKHLLAFLLLVVTPSFLILDGYVGTYDAYLLILLYLFFLYLFQEEQNVLETLEREHLTRKAVLHNLAKILGGVILVYFASRILVDKTVFFAAVMGIPPFLLSMLILSLGTNLPEFVIAANSIFHRRSDIAFGDYVGSAAANPLLFGIFALMHGPFTVQSRGFDVILVIMFLGYALFFMLARSKNRLSRYEGIALIIVYVLFVLFQATEIVLFSRDFGH